MGYLTPEMRKRKQASQKERNKENRDWKRKYAKKPGAARASSSGLSHLSAGYLAYIRSKRWQAVKTVYFHEVAHACALCRAYHVDLHHRTYERFRKEWWSDLVPLCRPCHDLVHAGSIGLLPSTLPNKPLLPRGFFV